MSKTKSIVILIITALLVAFFGFASFASDIPFGVNNYKSIFGTISKGIDIAGGYYAVLVPNDENSAEDVNNEDNINSVIETLRERLDENGYTEATVEKQDGNNLRVEIPNVKDPDEVMELIGDQGELQFRNHEGTPLVTGDAIEHAYAGYDPQTGDPIVVLEFTADGQDAFRRATESVLAESSEDNHYLAIWLGDRNVSSPKVSEVIDSPQARIEKIETIEEATTIAAVINSGALRLKFDIGETRLISASAGRGIFGKDIVFDAEIASAIGLLIIFAILIVCYGGMGIAASIALLIYVILYVIVLAIFPWVQLTFPGIAGIILSIGMAVDANVIIFDRIKEEYGMGKTVTASINAGFKRAFVTVLDSNVTTILAAIVLWILSSGSIKGFAITLFLGVLVSLFTSIVLTRFFINVLRPLTENEEKFYVLRRDA